MKAMVSQYYPGLEIGCTEYNWGDEPNLNGATTQADVLGIYGREGFDLATRWTVANNTSTTPTTYYVTYLASQIYRNYDGNDSTFGDTSVEADVANPDNLSAFASVRESDGALTVMVINKQQGSTPVTVSLANFSTSGTAQAWQINSASQTSIARLADLTVANNSVSTTVPSQSITLFVIAAGSTLSPPSAPTGLAATVGNGTVTLTWNPAGGATSYTVQRATASAGPYATVATLGSSPTSFTDSGLNNGTTYYYVVTGANAAGTSPNSSVLPATPLVPPTFTSSATASPNPVTQGVSTAINAAVNDTANTLTNGVVQIIVLDPTGAAALTQNFTGQSFTSGQSHVYQVSLVPSLAGAYTVEIGVFSSTNQVWNWNSSAAAITVNSNLTFTSSAPPNPSTFAPGASTTIAVSVTDTGTGALSNSIVELQVFDKSGNAAMTTYWTGQNFTAGQTLQFSYIWNSSASLATGTYSVDIGVFDSTWAHNYYWNGSAGSIAISNLQPPPAPAVVSTTPSSGSGASQSFALQYSDTAGVANLQTVWAYFSSTLADPASNSCLLYYNVAANLINLAQNSGTTWVSATPGASTTLQNTQCSLNVAAMTVSLSGNTLTLNLPITFLPAYAGGKNVYLYAADVSGANSGWQQRGTWTVPAVSGTPAAVSVAPSSGSGASQSFALQYSDTAGAANLQTVWVYFSSTLANPASNSCLLYYNVAANLINLAQNSGTTWVSATPGASTTLQNTQCSLNVAAMTLSLSGNTLTLNLPITFLPAYVGGKNIYLYAADVSGANSGWQQRGTWTVPAASGTPAAVSVAPSSGSGASQSFALQYSDTAGAANLQTVWAYFSSTLANPASNSCLLYYNVAANLINLAQNSGTAWVSATPGAATTLQNSQCSLNVAATTVVLSGNTLTLTLPMTFLPAYAGAKNIYLYAADVSGSASGWRQLGTWTVPAPAGVPTAVSVTPNSGSIASQSFTLQYSDTAGAVSLQTVWVYFSSTLADPASNSCLLYYNVAANQINLAQNSGTTWLPATPGASTTLQNSQCSLNVATTTVVLSGNALTVTLPMTFLPAYAGAIDINLYAADISGSDSGWQQLGTWTVP